MHQLNIALAVMGLAVVLIALVSAAVHRNAISEPILAIAVGVAVGPYGLELLDLAKWGDGKLILEQASRITLAIGLMGVALRLKRESVAALLLPAGVMVTLGMLGMWLASAAIVGWLLDLSFWTALLLGGVLTPTDPVVASSIVTGKFARQHLPLRVRDGLSLESGANDGLAYLLVMLPIFMLAHEPGAAWSKWITESLLVGMLGASLLGWVIGFGAAKLLKLAKHCGLVETTSLLGYSLAFSLFTLGAAALIDADGIISVFLAGITFNLCSDVQDEHEEEEIQEGVAKLFTVPMFVLFGLALPFSEWAEIGWPLLALATLILTLRRAPIVAVLLPMLRPYWNRKDCAFLGWFAPIGIAAIYYSTVAEKHTQDPLFWYVTSSVVFASVLAHGLTSGPLSRLYAAHRGTADIPEKTGDLSAKKEE